MNSDLTRNLVDTCALWHEEKQRRDYDPSRPITSVIAIPRGDKAGAILRGRYLGAAEDDPRKTRVQSQQILVPGEVVAGLLANIFRIKNLLDAVILMVGVATILALLLVFALSLRLRQREVQTIFKLGCSRATIARLLSAEIAIVLMASALLTVLFLGVVEHYDEPLVRALFVR